MKEFGQLLNDLPVDVLVCWPHYPKSCRSDVARGSEDRQNPVVTWQPSGLYQNRSGWFQQDAAQLPPQHWLQHKLDLTLLDVAQWRGCRWSCQHNSEGERQPFRHRVHACFRSVVRTFQGLHFSGNGVQAFESRNLRRSPFAVGRLLDFFTWTQRLCRNMYEMQPFMGFGSDHGLTGFRLTSRVVKFPLLQAQPLSFMQNMSLTNKDRRAIANTCRISYLQMICLNLEFAWKSDRKLWPNVFINQF